MLPPAPLTAGLPPPPLSFTVSSKAYWGEQPSGAKRMSQAAPDQVLETGQRPVIMGLRAKAYVKRPVETVKLLKNGPKPGARGP